MHTHPSYLFVLTFNDQVSFKINTREIIAKPNKIMALSPNIPHNEIFTDRFPRYIAIFIDKEFFEDQLNQYAIVPNIFLQGDFFPVPPGFLYAVKEFLLEVNNDIPGAQSVILATSLKICHLLIRSMLNLEYKKDKIIYRLEIDRSIEYMHSNLDQKITVKSLAKTANMSPSNYSRTFKKETGQSCISYLNQIRLEHVKRLLLEGDKTITEIALECGFSSPAYLSSSFYNRYKLSPTEYQSFLNNDDFSKV
ncbi:hypothetical protein DSY4786 [Desulfitobacterium hafniense Y51]|uniref:HTH araC/xylS-type domain-containing protein n=1 Tax=Desulfitobacterium hafniense (strain Y51) TaxID=138119 RepID=Q24N17_DESHY|nr:hypothetical protein DSY4786 [Desulfitobacterium hafniense Y51]